MSMSDKRYIKASQKVQAHTNFLLAIRFDSDSFRQFIPSVKGKNGLLAMFIDIIECLTDEDDSCSESEAENKEVSDSHSNDGIAKAQTGVPWPPLA